MSPSKSRTDALMAGEELSSAAQRERRKRIVDATIALASKGGFDAVQMRAVADRADVALGTLYRYFPSKVHLLVSSLAVELERAQEKMDRTTVPGDSPYERVLFVLGRITRGLQRNPHLTEAMTRAFTFADASAGAEIDRVSWLMESMFTRAMSEEEPTDEQKAIARVIGDVWLSALVGWVTGRTNAVETGQQIEVAVKLLLRD